MDMKRTNVKENITVSKAIRADHAWTVPELEKFNSALVQPKTGRILDRRQIEIVLVKSENAQRIDRDCE